MVFIQNYIGGNSVMQEIINDLLQVLSTVEDLDRELEIISLGLETKEEYFGISVLELEKIVLAKIEAELQNVISRIENDFLEK